MTISPAKPWAGWLLRCLLLLQPGLLYAGGITTHFGLRDDYAMLRESREEPGRILAANAAHGRPLYGWTLEHSFRRLDGIDELCWPRWWSAALFGLVCAALAWVLEVQLGWARSSALLVAAWLATLPGVQVIVHWAICWPVPLAGGLGLAAFALHERTLRATARSRRAAGMLGGGLLLLTALLVYQPTTLLFVVPLAAGWLAREAQPLRVRLAWAARHALLLGAALVAAFLLDQALFALGFAHPSARFHVETAWLDKLGWFLRHPLPNALALGVLDDVAGRTEPWHALAATSTALLIGAGGLLAWRRRGAAGAAAWWGGWVALAFSAYAVSLVAAERWASYRTILALGGVSIVFAVHALTQARRRVVRWLPAAVAFASAVLAVHDSRAYLVDPQARELRRIEEAAQSIDPAAHPRVALWLPLPADALTEVRYLDEFGSLSADAEWCAKEMLRLVLRERFPAQTALVDRVQYSSNYTTPPVGSFDTLLDLRWSRDEQLIARGSAAASVPQGR